MTQFAEAINELAPAGQETACRVRILHVGGTLEKVENRYRQLSEAWLETSTKKLEL